MQLALTILLVVILNLQLITTGVSRQTLAPTESQNISCKNGQVLEVHNGTACICNSGFHLSLGKCINPVYFKCLITVGLVMVAFLLFTGVVMFSRRSGVGEFKKGTGVEVPDQITTSLQIHNSHFHTDAAPSGNLNIEE